MRINTYSPETTQLIFKFLIDIQSSSVDQHSIELCPKFLILFPCKVVHGSSFGTDSLLYSIKSNHQLNRSELNYKSLYSCMLPCADLLGARPIPNVRLHAIVQAYITCIVYASIIIIKYSFRWKLIECMMQLQSSMHACMYVHSVYF